jgi:hypothetical protein
MGQEETITLKRPLIKLCNGRLGDAAFLGQVVYYSGPDEKWFYRTYKNWEEDICVKERTCQDIAARLERQGLISTKIRKVNETPRKFYRANLDVVEAGIEALFSTGFTESVVPGSTDSVGGVTDSVDPVGSTDSGGGVTESGRGVTESVDPYIKDLTRYRLGTRPDKKPEKKLESAAAPEEIFSAEQKTEPEPEPEQEQEPVNAPATHQPGLDLPAYPAVAGRSNFPAPQNLTQREGNDLLIGILEALTHFSGESMPSVMRQELNFAQLPWLSPIREADPAFALYTDKEVMPSDKSMGLINAQGYVEAATQTVSRMRKVIKLWRTYQAGLARAEERRQAPPQLQSPPQNAVAEYAPPPVGFRQRVLAGIHNGDSPGPGG